jgi:hypothetical protein
MMRRLCTSAATARIGRRPCRRIVGASAGRFGESARAAHALQRRPEPAAVVCATVLIVALIGSRGLGSVSALERQETRRVAERPCVESCVLGRSQGGLPLGHRVGGRTAVAARVGWSSRRKIFCRNGGSGAAPCCAPFHAILLSVRGSFESGGAGGAYTTASECERNATAHTCNQPRLARRSRSPNEQNAIGAWTRWTEHGIVLSTALVYSLTCAGGIVGEPFFRTGGRGRPIRSL